MTFLVDTSVWSLSLRKDGPTTHPAVEKLQRLIVDAQHIVLLGIILQEILQGFKHLFESELLFGCFSTPHLKPK